MAKERTKKVLDKMFELAKQNGGKRPPMGKVMLECGFSKSYARNPYQLKGTETFQDLCKIFIPESKMLQIHGDLMEATEVQHYIFPKVGNGASLSKKEIKAIVESVPGCKLIYIKNDSYTGQIAFYQAPDSKSRRSALDMAYKLKGKYAPDQLELTTRKYQHLTDEELDAEIEKCENALLKKN